MSTFLPSILLLYYKGGGEEVEERLGGWRGGGGQEGESGLFNVTYNNHQTIKPPSTKMMDL